MIPVAFARMVAAFSGERLARYESEVLPVWRREGIDAREVLDLECLGAWETCRRAWRTVRETNHADVLCVLQDDFIPCHGFVHALQSFLARSAEYDAWCVFQPAAVPAEVRALMSSRTDFDIPDSAISWGGSLLLRRHVVNRVLDRAALLGGFGQMDDLRLATALRQLGIKTRNVGVPIVRHVGAYWPSLCGNDDTRPESVEYRAGYSFADDKNILTSDSTQSTIGGGQ